jgi:photosystem II stability/assembly factor-like uncharacterized protein
VKNNCNIKGLLLNIGSHITSFTRLALLTLVTTSFLILKPSLVLSQWTWQNPLPSGANYRGCDFIDSSKGWIVGDWGCIIRTSDGGHTWEVQHSGVEADLYNVFFLDENYGWAVGNRGTILHTKNGGKNWLIQQYGTVTSAYISSVYFADSLNGWTDGTSGGGQYYRTTNGGNNWQMAQIPGVSYSWELSSMDFTDSLFFWALTGVNEISHTEDGGNTWISNYSPTGWGEIFFVNHDTGWVTANSQIFRTNDRAATWIEQDHPNQGGVIYGLHFTDPLHGWAAGEYILLKTNDGGETWESTETDVLFWNVEFSGISNGWAVGGWNGELFNTTDGGISWNQKRYGTDGYVTKIGFGSGDFGVAIYYTSMGEHSIDQTANGGITWTQHALLDDSIRWNGLSILDYNSGWLCGEKGTIMHTGNGGISWEIQRENHPIERLSEIQFINLLEGFAAGMDTSYENIFIVKTTDGGLTWSTITESFDGYMQGMWFTDSSNGYIIAHDINMGKAVILITRTGGESWEIVDLPLSSNEYGTSIQFVSPEVGFISANNYILKTTDRAETWSKTYISGYIPNSLWFTDSINGWCVGRTMYNGFALRTTDGGANWNNVPLETDHELLDVFFTALENGWACGDGGTILKWGQNNPVTIKETSLGSDKLNCSIYPNPCNAKVTLSISLNRKQEVIFRLFNLKGQQMKSFTYHLSGPGNDNFTFPVNDLPTGLYFYNLSSGNENTSGKIVIMH